MKSLIFKSKFFKCFTLLVLFSALTFTSALANSLPQAGTVTPSSGSSLEGETVTFATTCTDSDGYQDIKTTLLLVNTKAQAKTGVCVYYNRQKNKLYLLQLGSGYIGGYAPGSANTITNGYATLDCSRTTVSGSGNTLTINWNITFKDAFMGRNYYTYLYATDNTNAGTGWQAKGTWNLNHHSPQTGTITPNSGSSFP
ncbi:MAG: hypothetical protein ABID09_06790, partial [Candidatus Omnitrophota bacterium]